MPISYHFNPLANIVIDNIFTLIIKPGILNSVMEYSFAPFWNGGGLILAM